MRVGIIQSSYIPWRGYFDFIDDVDLFIFLDDVQFTPRDWRSRNQIKTRNGLRWVSVPVQRPEHRQAIIEKIIDEQRDWRQQHINLMTENYRKAPFFNEIIAEYQDVLRRSCGSLSDLNIALTRWLMSRLGITTPVVQSADFKIIARKTERLLELLRAVGATVYLTGPSAEAYLDIDSFRAAGIGLEYKSYDYLPYSQLWGDFIGTVTVLDLLFNVGPEARNYLKSMTPNRRVLCLPAVA